MKTRKSAARVRALPCPFCGDRPWVGPFVVKCDSSPKCQVEPRVYGVSQRRAIERWNTRHVARPSPPRAGKKGRK